MVHILSSSLLPMGLLILLSVVCPVPPPWDRRITHSCRPSFAKCRPHGTAASRILVVRPLPSAAPMGPPHRAFLSSVLCQVPPPSWDRRIGSSLHQGPIPSHPLRCRAGARCVCSGAAAVCWGRKKGTTQYGDLPRAPHRGCGAANHIRCGCSVARVLTPRWSMRRRGKEKTGARSSDKACTRSIVLTSSSPPPTRPAPNAKRRDGRVAPSPFPGLRCSPVTWRVQAS